jgi:hypothetical protein
MYLVVFFVFRMLLMKEIMILTMCVRACLLQVVSSEVAGEVLAELRW